MSVVNKNEQDNAPRRRNYLTFEQKRQILKFYVENIDLSHRQLADWVYEKFQIRVGRSTLSRLLCSSLPACSDIDRKKKKAVKFPELEQKLLHFLNNTTSKLTDVVIRQKAAEFRTELGISEQEFKISDGWFARFKKRNSLGYQRLQRQPLSIRDSIVLQKHTQKLTSCLSKYKPEDVFAFDETSLFYQMPPSKTLIKDKNVAKQHKVTIGVCINITATEKIPALVISTQNNSFSLKHVDFYQHSEPQMTSIIFTEWLSALNVKMAGRKVLLLLDKAPTHLDLKLSNIELLFLPVHNPSFQPCSTGIIQSFKVKYKTNYISWLLKRKHSKNIDFSQAMCLVENAWEAVSMDTVQNSWLQTGIVPADFIEGKLTQNNDDLLELDKLIASLGLPDALEANAYAAIEHDGIDEIQVTADDVIKVKQDQCDEVSDQDALFYASRLKKYVASHSLFGDEDFASIENILRKCQNKCDNK